MGECVGECVGNRHDNNFPIVLADHSSGGGGRRGRVF